MTDRVPQVSRGTVWVFAVFMGGMGLFMLWRGLEFLPQWETHVGGVMAFLAVGLGLFLLAGWVSATTLLVRLDESRVSAWRPGGRIEMRWTEVERVECGPRGALWPHARDRTISVPTAFYRDFDDVIGWMTDRVPGEAAGR